MNPQLHRQQDHYAVFRFAGGKHMLYLQLSEADGNIHPEQ
jgi:hypothetical protein